MEAAFHHHAGEFMTSTFLEALLVARSLVNGGDTSALDNLIAEHNANLIETTSVRIIAEHR